MAMKAPERELVLEAGLLAAGLGLVGAAAVWLSSSAWGRVQQRRRRRRAPPAAGQVPAERHQHIAASSPR